MWKILSLAYNQSETRDKRPLGRDPDRSWCRHTTVKLFQLQPMALWTAEAANEYTMSMEPWAVAKIALL